MGALNVFNCVKCTHASHFVYIAIPWVVRLYMEITHKALASGLSYVHDVAHSIAVQNVFLPFSVYRSRFLMLWSYIFF